jgi:hypothetical protein
MCYCNKLGKKWRGYRFSIAEATKKEKNTSHVFPKSSPFLYLDAVLWAVPASEAFAKGSAVIGSLTTRVSCQSLLLDLVYRISPKGPFKVLRFSGQIMPEFLLIHQELEEQSASGFEMQRDLSRTKTLPHLR